MHKLLLDLRFAVRQLRKNFGFATTTIVTLALGIGATTAIFSLIYAVLLQPLPFPHPQELVNVTKGTRSNGVTLPESVSYPDFFDWRNQNHSFSGITCYHDRSITMTGHGEARHLDITVVSSEFFRVLGVAPTLGRDFLADDEKPGAHVVILSHQFWASEFGADNNVIGSSITLDGRSYSIAGVMPKDFEFPIETPKRALWTTLAIDAEGKDPQTGQRGFDSLSALGRLKPQVTLDQARADMNVIAARLAAQYPDTNKNNDAATVESELESLVGSRRTALNVLFASVVLLLLISCANVAGLMLARGARRAPEIAVRASLGATRGAITRQVLVESLLLAV
ncbi:MAG TPA: ABC transporter permease, partial [Candidatus Angelobacter sp.]